jgi:succinate dehydrogenase/fumarate reductase cytochrome b subunit (b558 family)
VAREQIIEPHEPEPSESSGANAAADAGAGSGPGLGRRLFSLSGVLPLGFFLLAHTWANVAALRGQRAYVHTVEAMLHVPLLPLVEVVLVFAPLAYHAGYGLWVMRSAPSEDKPYGTRLQITDRVAAVVALAFIVWHVFELRVRAFHGGLAPQAFYATLVWHLSSTWHGFPVRAVLYLFGVGATVFHFACGAWSYGVTSGLLASNRQKRRAAWGAVALGTMLFVASSATVISMATGLQFEGNPETSVPCVPKKSR